MSSRESSTIGVSVVAVADRCRGVVGGPKGPTATARQASALHAGAVDDHKWNRYGAGLLMMIVGDVWLLFDAFIIGIVCCAQ
jgi:hypothetical protein